MLEITATGNLGQDATIIQVSNDKKGIKFSIVDNEKWTGADGTTYENATWINCVKWIKATDSQKIANYLKKGARVIIKGKPKADGYINNQGEHVTSLAVDVNYIEIQKFVDKPADQ